jgi:hypothetical protein
VSDFVSGSQLSLLFQDEDIVFAWLWAIVFALSSLLVAWSFWWRLV